MQDEANDASSSQPTQDTTIHNLVSRRLALLRTEVDLDFEGLISALERGLQVVLVTDRDLGKDLDRDVLRRIGGMTMLCQHYGAAVIFVNNDKLGEFTTKDAPKG